MQTRIFHMLFICLLMLVFPLMRATADEPGTSGGPDFPPDPGVVYVPPVVIIMGDTIDMSDTTQVMPVEIDVRGDSTVMYNTEENTITLTSASIEDTSATAISYSGSDTLKIILQDTSSIYADTIISSQSNVVVSGEGQLEAVGTVPIIGTPNAGIIFDSVRLHAQSVPSKAALQRRILARRSGIKFSKYVDETGGPALSGFGSADFNKVNVTPGGEDASYGPIAGTGGEEEDPLNALYLPGEDGEQEVLDEFWLEPVEDGTAVPLAKTQHALDLTKPMYNLLGMPVVAGYQGIVIQNGQAYLLR